MWENVSSLSQNPKSKTSRIQIYCLIYKFTDEHKRIKNILCNIYNDMYKMPTAQWNNEMRRRDVCKKTQLPHWPSDEAWGIKSVSLRTFQHKKNNWHTTPYTSMRGIWNIDISSMMIGLLIFKTQTTVLQDTIRAEYSIKGQ